MLTHHRSLLGVSKQNHPSPHIQHWKYRLTAANRRAATVPVADSTNGNSSSPTKRSDKDPSNIEDMLLKYETEEKKLVIPSQKQRQERIQQKSASGPAAPTSPAAAGTPKTCKEAIDAGLKMFNEGKYDEALELFQSALELPGQAMVRYNSPRWFNVPSDEEENSAMYNMACCYARKGQVQSAITCIEFILENGFDQFDTVRKDPDLRPIQGAALEGVLGKYDNFLAKLKKQVTKPKEYDSNKPWIMW